MVIFSFDCVWVCQTKLRKKVVLSSGGIIMALLLSKIYLIEIQVFFCQNYTLHCSHCLHISLFINILASYQIKFLCQMRYLGIFVLNFSASRTYLPPCANYTLACVFGYSQWWFITTLDHVFALAGCSLSCCGVFFFPYCLVFQWCLQNHSVYLSRFQLWCVRDLQ